MLSQNIITDQMPTDLPYVVKQVLVVDDSRSQRRILSMYLKRWGYQTLEADSGTQALEICKSQKIDMIISDWMMPGMNGLELCRALRNLQSNHYSYFILLTSKSEKNEVAHGLDIGADDFLTKPVAALELRSRIRAGERILKMEQELIEKNRLVNETLTEISGLYNSLDRDLLEARGLQQSLVREKSRDFGAAQLSILFRPSGHVGGDLVGFFKISETKIGFYSIDVSGHGVASALMTARLAAYLSGASADQNLALSRSEEGKIIPRSPSHAAKHINSIILDEMETDIYFTMMLGFIDTSTGIVKLVQCGHPPAAVQRRNGSVEFHGDGGFPIGLMSGATWTDYEIHLDPGDRVILSSDGITECPRKQGGMLEEDGFASLLHNRMDLKGIALLDKIASDLIVISEDEKLPDDVSAVMLEYNHQS